MWQELKSRISSVEAVHSPEAPRAYHTSVLNTTCLVDRLSYCDKQYYRWTTIETMKRPFASVPAGIPSPKKAGRYRGAPTSRTALRERYRSQTYKVQKMDFHYYRILDYSI